MAPSHRARGRLAALERGALPRLPVPPWRPHRRAHQGSSGHRAPGVQGHSPVSGESCLAHRGAARASARGEHAGGSERPRGIEPSPTPGRSSFRWRERLPPRPDPEGDSLFFVFGERNGDQSYGSGRFLTASAPRGGKVMLDFNQAINPPCAFTPYPPVPCPRREPAAVARGGRGEARGEPLNRRFA